MCTPAVTQENASTKPTAVESQASHTLFLAVLICCFSPILFGYSMGYTSPIQNTMEGDKVHGVRPPSDLVATTPGEFPWFASVLNLGAILGAFSGSYLMEAIGRRRALALTVIPHVVGYLGIALLHNKFHEFLGFRFLIGWAVGVGTAVTPVYIGEVSTTSLRGVLGAANQLAVTIGLFLANVAGNYMFVVEFEGETFFEWRHLAYLGATVSVPLLLILIMPESPSWLAKQGQMQATSDSLRSLRKGDVSEEVAAEMKSRPGESQGEVAEVVSVQSASLSDYKKPLVVGAGLLIFQQFSGVNAVMMFAGSIVEDTGFDDPDLASTIMMGAQVLFTAFSCLIMERVGRRTLLLISTLVMALCHAVLSYYFLALNNPALPTPSILALGSLGMFILGFSVGIGPIPWLIIAELFPTEVVNKAASVGVGLSWMSSFLVTLLFLPLQKAITTQGVFLVFTILCSACFLFVLTLVPETRGRSVAEVLALMQNGESSGKDGKGQNCVDEVQPETSDATTV